MMHKAWSSIEEVSYCFLRSSVKFQGLTALKSVAFDPDWPFPDCNSSLNSPMAMKCCTMLEVALKRWPIVFEGHPSNFKATRLKKASILTQIRRFRTVTPVCIHQWLRNDTKSLKQHRRGALLFFGVIHQISRSHGLKIDDLNPIWLRLLGRSQLSSPSDLPCLTSIIMAILIVCYTADCIVGRFLYHTWFSWISIYVCAKYQAIHIFLLLIPLTKI